MCNPIPIRALTASTLFRLFGLLVGFAGLFALLVMISYSVGIELMLRKSLSLHTHSCAVAIFNMVATRGQSY